MSPQPKEKRVLKWKRKGENYYRCELPDGTIFVIPYGGKSIIKIQQHGRINMDYSNTLFGSPDEAMTFCNNLIYPAG